jgi:hypothetical protein
VASQKQLRSSNIARYVHCVWGSRAVMISLHMHIYACIIIRIVTWLAVLSAVRLLDQLWVEFLHFYCLGCFVYAQNVGLFGQYMFFI